MKLKIILFSLLLIPTLSFSQDKVKFLAAGVTCSLCSNAIHKSLKTSKEIKNINPDLETQEWNLEYEKGTFNLEILKKKIEDAGFTLEKVWVNGEMKYEKKKKQKNGNKEK